MTDHALIITPGPDDDAPLRRAEIRVTDDEVVVSGLHLAEPTHLVLHTGRRESLRFVGVIGEGTLRVEQCRDESCECHA